MLSQGWSPVHDFHIGELETWVKSCILINPSLTYEQLQTNKSIIGKTLSCQQGNYIVEIQPTLMEEQKEMNQGAQLQTLQKLSLMKDTFLDVEGHISIT